MSHDIVQIVLQVFSFGALSVQLETLRRAFVDEKKKRHVERRDDLQRIVALEERQR